MTADAQATCPLLQNRSIRLAQGQALRTTQIQIFLGKKASSLRTLDRTVTHCSTATQRQSKTFALRKTHYPTSEKTDTNDKAVGLARKAEETIHREMSSHSRISKELDLSSKKHTLSSMK
tara:strand:- start:195 stop:554 length:360 start_codon:yes stop_codon:yes gene_type:complete